MSVSSNLVAAREGIENFYSDQYGPSSLEYLDNSLFDLKDLYSSDLSSQNDRVIIENIVTKLLDHLTVEAEAIFAVEPLPPLERTTHWIEVMKLPKALGWETPQDFKDAGKELERIKGAILSHQGHITEEFRRFVIDNEVNPDDEW